ncbi:MAG: threonylcarbamoyl-AMP synthase [Silvanigrellaceae bacterium]|nr:threonylcarbamoyl-AMP synthase [Silvanigrellaceae bacterium]
MAKILKVSNRNIKKCAALLKSGQLVSFPTETVYGLGADASNLFAIEKIFNAKGRPKTDPLIVHLSHLEKASLYLSLSDKAKKSLNALGKKFWPGPLTLVLRSNGMIPKIVTAQGDFIALRVPAHPVALALLQESDLPIAAPSANTFGHVSPTTAQHVFSDLGSFSELTILDDGSHCPIGIESTVAKIDDFGNVSILRPGALSQEDIKNCFLQEKIDVVVSLNLKNTKLSNNQEVQDSPGQLITHYAPSLDTYIISPINIDENYYSIKFTIDDLSNSVVIDYKKENICLANSCLYYFDLSKNGNPEEVAQNLFRLLREAENLNGAKYILLPYLKKYQTSLLDAVYDRIFRSASGKFAELDTVLQS